jgi:hypothetical protein
MGTLASKKGVPSLDYCNQSFNQTFQKVLSHGRTKIGLEALSKKNGDSNTQYETLKIQ